MKKIFIALAIALATLTYNIQPAAAYRPNPAQRIPVQPFFYVPATGPLQLADIITRTGTVTQRGAIMHSLMNNPNLQTELQAIMNFYGARGNQLKSYQAIMQDLSTSIDTTKALAALKAFEHVIMLLYNYRAYVVSSNYNPYLNTFITGIRWSWFNPLEYLKPNSYLSDNNQKLNQLIDELENIAHTVYPHNRLISQRMMLTVASYRHWRKVIAATVTGYFLANGICHAWKDDWKNASAKLLYDGGLGNILPVMGNAYEDMKNASAMTFNASCAICSAIKNMACATGNVLMHGIPKKQDPNAPK